MTTSHPEFGSASNPGSLCEPIPHLLAARDRAVHEGNLARALELDNELEDLVQPGNWARRTCWPCGRWADHVHEPATGARMLVDGEHPVSEYHTTTALHVFALAATALPHQWTDTYSAAQVVIDFGPYRYTVTVHTGTGGTTPDRHQRARAVYISQCQHRLSGQARAFPVIHAPEHQAATIITAYRYAVHVCAGPTPPAPAAPPASAATDGVEDPDELLRRFHILQAEIDAELDGGSDATDPAGDGEHRDRLAALHRDASELMDAMDTHLRGGGELPRAWAADLTA
ncbi:hypothetical protein ABIA39_000276 [Nocardia sp. GAS34]|uniref:hypothetical protein n=1 Tax=unclassified Nocardia TaxID=2637762 RepID=UPI003D23A0BC